MPNYNRNFSLDDIYPLMKKYEELVQIRNAIVELTGEEKLERILISLSKISQPEKTGQGRLIYLVQSETQAENNTVKVGFCHNLQKRWGSKWSFFVNQKSFPSPFTGDSEVHSHLRGIFERDLENGRETYFGNFDEICLSVENFLTQNT
jgi:hypothetical protein